LTINLEQLKQILELVRTHELTELEVEEEGVRVRVRKDGTPVAAPVVVAAAAPLVSALATPHAPAVAGTPAQVIGVGDADTDVELAVVKSPIVGTFYRSPEPGAAAFVEIGSVVKKGDVLCIIEAMKLMNEIDSEYDGEIVSVYVESGQPVQYGERLYAIRTR
jgi:acetyl-CoA carboxylase biotin carboxyl carrier protein